MSVPTSTPVNFERLFVLGEEVTPMKPINVIKPIDTKKEVTTADLAESFNQLIKELRKAGYMKD